VSLAQAWKEGRKEGRRGGNTLTRLCVLFPSPSSGKEYHRLFTHYGRTDDLDKDPTAGRKETRYYANSSQAEAAYAALIEEKTDKRRYHKVDMASGNIGSDKARARYAAPVTSEQSSAQPSGIPSSLHPMVRYLVDYIYSEATSRLTATVSAKVGPLPITFGGWR